MDAAWLEWDQERTYRRIAIPGTGTVQTWTELTKIEGRLVSFRTTFVSTATARC